MADVEQHAARAPVDHRFAWSLRVSILLAAYAPVHVREDVASPEVLVQKIVKRPARSDIRAKIDHHRNFGRAAHLDSSFVRRPLRAAEMRALDADDHALVFQRHGGRRCDFHVCQVLLDGTGSHPRADDVDEGHDARF